MVGKALAVTAIIFPIYSGLGEITQMLSLEYIHILNIYGIYIRDDHLPTLHILAETTS